MHKWHKRYTVDGEMSNKKRVWLIYSRAIGGIADDAALTYNMNVFMSKSDGFFCVCIDWHWIWSYNSLNTHTCARVNVQNEPPTKKKLMFEFSELKFSPKIAQIEYRTKISSTSAMNQFENLCSRKKNWMKNEIEFLKNWKITKTELKCSKCRKNADFNNKTYQESINTTQTEPNWHEFDVSVFRSTFACVLCKRRHWFNYKHTGKKNKRRTQWAAVPSIVFTHNL